LLDGFAYASQSAADSIALVRQAGLADAAVVTKHWKHRCFAGAVSRSDGVGATIVHEFVAAAIVSGGDCSGRQCGRRANCLQ
jgi:hypothetical protein